MKKERKFNSGSVRDCDKGKLRYDLISPYAMRSLAASMRDGMEKYGERNWEKGQSNEVLTASFLRHFNSWLLGKDDEDHLRQAFWNLHGLVHFQELGKEVELDEDNKPVKIKGQGGLNNVYFYYTPSINSKTNL